VSATARPAGLAALCATDNPLRGAEPLELLDQYVLARPVLCVVVGGHPVPGGRP
jgi:hypothetical protein